MPRIRSTETPTRRAIEHFDARNDAQDLAYPIRDTLPSLSASYARRAARHDDAGMRLIRAANRADALALSTISTDR